LAEGNDKWRGNIKNGKNSGQSNKTKTKNKQQKLLTEKHIYMANGMSPNKEYIFIYSEPAKVSFFFQLFWSTPRQKVEKWAPQNKNKENKREKKTNKQSNIFHLVTNFRSRYFGFFPISGYIPTLPPSPAIFPILFCPFVLRNVFPKNLLGKK